MADADDFIAVFKAAAQANASDTCRKGNIVVLPDTGRLVATGDLHGHRRNFEKIVRYAQLDASPNNHVILHEMIHGGPTDAKGGDLSFEMIHEACKLKVRHPNQVHFLLGNHDLAQMSGQDIARQGTRCLDAFEAGMKNRFGPRAPEVIKSLYAFFRSQPIACRAGVIFFSHSTPARRFFADFDPTVFERPITATDCERPGSVYSLVWGRVFDQPTADNLARRLNCELFIIGHEPQPEGWHAPTNRHIILASDHNHGVCMAIQLGRKYTQGELTKLIKPLAGLP
jgi:hypothetical protein